MKKNVNIFDVEVKQSSPNGIEVAGNVEIYNLDGISSLKDWGSDFINKTRGSVNTTPMTTQRSAFNEGANVRPMREDALAILVSAGNTVGTSARQVYFMNLRPHSNDGSIFITPQNFTECVVSFAARKLSANMTTWVMDKIPYLVPNVEHENFDEFSYDATVLSLFHRDSNFISHKAFGKDSVELKNNMFYLSNKDLLEVADKTSNIEMFSHAKSDNEERFVYQLLSTLEEHSLLSQEAKKLLEIGRAITLEVAKIKKVYAEKFPEKSLNRWDIGWLQTVQIAREEAVLNNEFKTMLGEFDKAMKDLVEKMNPMVLELGFLRNLN